MDKNQENNQEELEQKISEAELEAQAGEITPPEERVSSFEPEVVDVKAEEVPPSKQPMSRARKVWRRVLVWLVVIALAFAGGFFVDTYLRYLPEKADLQEARSEIAALEAEISLKQEEIDSLEIFEDQNISLTEEIRDLETRLTLLISRTAVAEAALAVERGQEADARLALDKLGSSLQTLKSSLNAEQAEVVDNMIQRLQLILIELENEEYSVGTDLELLSTRLITLENNLFASP